MSTRRTLFTLGALVAAVALLAPAAALAQMPTNVGISATTPDPSFDQLTVTWDIDGEALTTGYRIYFRKQAVGAAATSDNAPTATDNTGTMDVDGRTTKMATLEDLDHNSTYRAAVSSLEKDGIVRGALVQSSNNSVVAMKMAKTLEADAPAPPRNVTAMGGDMTFTVTWDEPYAGEAGLTIKEYRVQKRESAGGLFGDWIPPIEGAKADETINDDGKKVDGDTTTITFEGLDNGITYQARVLAINSVDVTGDYSIRDNDDSAPGDEAATVGDEDDMDDMEETPALPLFGILALLGGLVAAGRARLRR